MDDLTLYDCEKTKPIQSQFQPIAQSKGAEIKKIQNILYFLLYILDYCIIILLHYRYSLIVFCDIE